MFLDDFGINYMGPEAARSGARMLAPPQSTLRPSPHDCGLVGPPYSGYSQFDEVRGGVRGLWEIR